MLRLWIPYGETVRSGRVQFLDIRRDDLVLDSGRFRKANVIAVVARGSICAKDPVLLRPD